MNPADFFFKLTKLYTYDKNAYDKEVQQILCRYRVSHNMKPIQILIQYVERTYITYKNPNRINATRQFFTTLQEEAVPKTSKAIFLLTHNPL